MRLVLDASAPVRMVMRAEGADGLLESVATVVAAPSLYASEVANVLLKYVKAGTLDAETALERLEESINLIDAFTPDWELSFFLVFPAIARGLEHGD